MAVTDDLQQFMSIGAQPGQMKSFEEVRIDDYLKAYMSTGRPPAPVTQEPASEVARAALGLPPLFKPYKATPPGGPSTSTTSPSPAPTRTNPMELPNGQNFTPTKVDGETYQSITAAAEYAFWSPEELRYYAYLRGVKAAPLGVTMVEFGLSAPVPGASSSASSTTSTPTLASGETLQCIISQPAFADHSFEELRVYSMLAGKEVNSAEIRQLLNPTAGALAVQPTSIFGGAPSTPAPAPVIATPGPSFSFGVTPATPSVSAPASNFSFGQPVTPAQPSILATPSSGFSFKFGA